MNQSSVGSMLVDLFDLDVNLRVRVDRADTGDEDAPGWKTASPVIDMMLEPAGVKDRQAGVMADYSHPVTQVAFCNADAALRVGCRLVEYARRRERGDFVRIPNEERQTYFVLAIERVPGVPAPFGQVKLDLWQMSETRIVTSVE